MGRGKRAERCLALGCEPVTGLGDGVQMSRNFVRRRLLIGDMM